MYVAINTDHKDTLDDLARAIQFLPFPTVMQLAAELHDTAINSDPLASDIDWARLCNNWSAKRVAEAWAATNEAKRAKEAADDKNP